jgi:glycosyltransferase involved in cell wall biosynthesis
MSGFLRKRRLDASGAHGSAHVDTPGSLFRRDPSLFATAVIRCGLLRVREFLEFDWTLPATLVGFVSFAVARILYAAGRYGSSFTALSKVHGAGHSPTLTQAVTALVRSGVHVGETKGVLLPMLRSFPASLERESHSSKFFDHPVRLLGPTAIVLKSATAAEKGVINILYSYALPLFAKLFDIETIAKHYVIVLEPSWSGYCSKDILCYAGMNAPVIVQAYEPHDYRFIEALGCNLIPVAVSNNWWVDHRTFTPVPGVKKDVDLVMVAGWSDFKRHHRFFALLRRMRRSGRRPTVTLIGYPMHRSQADIHMMADRYGVLDQLEFHESLERAEVNRQFNRAKVNVIWSRKEGVNRAIIEGMFSGTPGLLRAGFNYGHPYEYVNHSTGRFAADNDAPEVIARLLDEHELMRPREWVLAHMTCQHATNRLANRLRSLSVSAGQRWRSDLSVKVNGLHGQDYWDDRDRGRFQADYEFLASCVRKVPRIDQESPRKS